MMAGMMVESLAALMVVLKAETMAEKRVVMKVAMMVDH